MTHARDNFLIWLRNAHAMEEQSVALLTTQSRRIESYPDLKARIGDHLAETRIHADLLQSLLDGFCGGGSIVRDMTAKLAARAHGVGGMLTNDEVVKGCAAAYAFEHSEIATYRMLIAAADELGEDEATAIFEKILAEEIAMADWLANSLDGITRVFLMRDERDLLAKR